MPRKPKTITYPVIWMSCGYVENQLLSLLYWQVQHKLPTSIQEAVESFVEYLYVEYVQRHPPNALPCPTCGNESPSAQPFDQYLWEEFLVKLHGFTMDDWGDPDHGEYGWVPWESPIFVLPKTQRFVFIDNADTILTAILARLHPELGIKEVEHLSDDIDRLYKTGKT